MPLVQPRGFLGRDEELRAIGVGARVGHADRVGLVVFERGELVAKFGTPDAFAAGAVAEGVAALRKWVNVEGERFWGSFWVRGGYLDHEFANHSVKDGVVVIAILRMSYKVLDSLGCCFGE